MHREQKKLETWCCILPNCWFAKADLKLHLAKRFWISSVVKIGQIRSTKSHDKSHDFLAWKIQFLQKYCSEWTKTDFQFLIFFPREIHNYEISTILSPRFATAILAQSFFFSKLLESSCQMTLQKVASWTFTAEKRTNPIYFLQILFSAFSSLKVPNYWPLCIQNLLK